MGGIGDRGEKSFAELHSIPNQFISNRVHLSTISLMNKTSRQAARLQKCKKIILPSCGRADFDMPGLLLAINDLFTPRLHIRIGARSDNKHPAQSGTWPILPSLRRSRSEGSSSDFARESRRSSNFRIAGAAFLRAGRASSLALAEASADEA
jgi:hypothetical protein